MNCNGSLSEVVYNALWDLYNSTNGIHWTWSTSLPSSTIWTFPSNLSTPCSNNWQGLVCSRESQNNCSLKEIDLGSYGLSGYLPSSLGNVVSLLDLSLAENSLSGTISSELGNLQSLVYFEVNTNSLSGTIPSELGSLCSLQQLYLYTNFLSGTLPSDLGNVVSMIYLDVSDNDLSGTVPTELKNLASLQILKLDANVLSGIISTQLGKLHLLQQMDLYTNSLSGTIPSELGNLHSLLYLYLNSDSLTGTIPTELGNLRVLQQLDLNTNCLIGTIPTEMGSPRLMNYLTLYSNSLSGSIPSELGNATSILYLELNTNRLTGTIPSSLGNLQSIEILSLYSNCLTGTIPSELQNLTSLELMWLEYNMLTGVVKSAFDNTSQLSLLSLSENALSGSILEELVHLKKLSILYLDFNLFTGTIPVRVNFTLLLQLDLSRNFLYGEISGLTNFHYLTQAFAAQNLLSGSMPESFFSFPLETFDLSDNFLDGSIGQQFSNCSYLQNIALGGNAFSGSIPDFFGHLPALIALNLSNNELSDKVSMFASLQSLDLSSNRLSGTLPFQLFEPTSLQDVLLNNNCFSGSLPETICSNSALQYLVMNALTSNCGSGIPKSLRPIFQGAVSQRLMSGSIPSCIWEMPELSLLQLSGNGLTGSIGGSELAARNSSLRSLLLSGNQLTGTIPEWIQTSSMLEQLDLSQNRLSGTLVASLVISSASSLFRASVNRLSGDLPDVLFSTSSNLTLDVLNGNQFSCSSAGGVAGWGSILSPSSLPQSDVNHDTYVCGSSFFDDFLLFASVCLLVVIFSVFIYQWIVNAALQPVVFKGFHSNWHGYCWSSLLLLSLLLVILFVSLHSPTLAQFNTHSKQYLWMTSAVFLRGWAPVLIILLAVGMGEVVITTTSVRHVNSNEVISQRDVSLTQVEWYRSIFSSTSVHILNIFVVIVTNAAYVYATVNGLPLDQLFIIQLSLGCFKLVWNGMAIPWFLRLFVKENNVTAHRVFMSLFAFIGGPLISTFFTDSNCFLYVVTPQTPLTSTVVVPKYYCFVNCLLDCEDNECNFYCSSTSQFQPVSVTTTSTPSWFYSYQCSSALLLNYIPVIIASMAISGFLLPCFVFCQFAFNGRVVFSSLARLAPRSMLVGNTFDVVQLDQFLQVKTLVNLTTMLTFGFACPLLGVLVVLDTFVWSWMRRVLVIRQVDHLKSNQSAAEKQFHLKDPISFEPSYGVTVLSFVGVFWSLFVFDMIGDVYGNLSGGLSMLAPLLLSAVMWLLMRCQNSAKKQSMRRSVTTPEVELCDDRFVENPLQLSEQVGLEP